LKITKEDDSNGKKEDKLNFQRRSKIIRNLFLDFDLLINSSKYEEVSKKIIIITCPHLTIFSLFVVQMFPFDVVFTVAEEK